MKTKYFVVQRKATGRYVGYTRNDCEQAREDYQLVKHITHAEVYTARGIKNFFLTLEGMPKDTSQFIVTEVYSMTVRIALSHRIRL